MQPQPVITDTPAEKVDCDAVVVTAYSGDPIQLDDDGTSIDAALDGALSTYLTETDFKAKPGDIEILPTLGRIAPKAVAIVGVGSRADATAKEIRKAAAAAAKRLSDRATVATSLGRASGSDTTAAVEGFLLGSYRFTKFKSDPKPPKLSEILLLGGDQPDIDRGVIFSEATTFTRDLANEPPNSLTPDALARRAKEIADVNGIECTIWDEDEIARRGFGGLQAVGRGALNPPRFIQLRYAPAGATERVALVGKGVTFDSGGLSLKPANSMETMKSDMAGAAAVIATMGALKRLEVGLEVLAFVPTTENLPSGDSLKPGDVITHYNGKTTEVNNTDAEGRLILADALAFAAEQKPKAIVDLATLTGGIMVALGTRISGAFASDDSLYSEIEEAADAAGESLWRMPMTDDFKRDLDSDVADMKNSGPRWGSASIGAAFLRQHVPNDIPWVHLDIAGTDWADKPHDLGPRGSTGTMTRTLIHWMIERGS